MKERIIRLNPKEKQSRIKLLEIEKNNNLFVDVHRENYNDELKGFFIRNKRGISVIVNSALPPKEQATAIKLLAIGANRCRTSEVGMVGESWDFVCGGSCCATQ
jgi:hypothetical protein